MKVVLEEEPKVLAVIGLLSRRGPWCGHQDEHNGDKRKYGELVPGQVSVVDRVEPNELAVLIDASSAGKLDHLTPQQVKYFDSSEKDEAFAWLTS